MTLKNRAYATIHFIACQTLHEPVEPTLRDRFVSRGEESLKHSKTFRLRPCRTYAQDRFNSEGTGQQRLRHHQQTDCDWAECEKLGLFATRSGLTRWSRSSLDQPNELRSPGEKIANASCDEFKLLPREFQRPKSIDS